MVKSDSKQLTAENWLEPDPASAMWVRPGPDGKEVPITGPEWTGRFLLRELPEAVPQDVTTLFEVARGSMLYGFYYYPLYTLGIEHLFRALEAAVTEKCIQLGHDRLEQALARKLDWLVERGVLNAESRKRWEPLRTLRNESSHPKHQMLVPPSWALHMLDVAAQVITGLFNTAPG